jgi:hypothetical protein
MILSEQTPAPLADETASDADGASLDTQLQEITAERDRHAADKLELIAKASALSKELEGARAQLATVSAERDDLRRKRDAAIAERDAAAAARDGAMAERDRLAAEATQAAAENARLGAQIANAGKPDPLVVFTDLLAEKTKALLAWIRSKIPENSPALARFDRAVEMATKAGCIAIKTIREVSVWLAPRLAAAYAWAKPRVLELIAKAKGGDKTANQG